MKIYEGISQFTPLPYAVVTSGTFDGVHLGHQQILHRLQEITKKNNGESVVITFWPHPRTVVSNDSPDLRLLTTIEEKTELLSQNGVDHLIIIPFTREFSELSSHDFIENVLVKTINTKKLIIGYDHRFGRNREGGFDYLQNHSDQYGFEIEEIPRHEIDHLTVSSTKIRNAIANGHVHTANELLGRAYSFSGLVAKGRQLGRTIGFPTANIQVPEFYKLIPAHGVYAVKIEVRHQTHYGIMNIGQRPTVDGIGRTQEVYIFDFEQDIYGEHTKVSLIDYIRAEQKFEGIDALKAQITTDCQTAKRMIANTQTT
jgi:riboflavin kinase / FMN adenylyltransferase